MATEFFSIGTRRVLTFIGMNEVIAVIELKDYPSHRYSRILKEEPQFKKDSET
ncbi:MAG: hypothetical protein ACE5I5_15900 [Candidatus Heimdallarchaeota archaeon]